MSILATNFRGKRAETNLSHRHDHGQQFPNFISLENIVSCKMGISKL